MKIAYIAAGAAGMYCGNCLRDHALAVALREIGEEVTLYPTYTPLLTDLPQGAEVHRAGLFFNGVRAYLAQKWEFFRRPRPLLDRVVGARFLVLQLSRLRLSTDASRLGELTVSMLRGEEGNQRRELDELCEAIVRDGRPDLVHLSNALLLGMARRLRQATGAPVVCSLQSEDVFIEGLWEPFRSQALDLIRERGRDVDHFLSVSAYYADDAARRLGLDREKISVVLSGVPLAGHEPPPARPPAGGLTLGFLGRMAPEKGLGLLVEAFIRLARRPGCERLRLAVAGDLHGRNIRWVRQLSQRLTLARLRGRAVFLGTVERERKLRFLRDVDVLALPALRPEAKGLVALEAFASGVPVVAPRSGVFPEIVELSGGGLLFAPEDLDDLVESVARLLTDGELRRSLGARARASAVEYFNAERMARQTLDAYRRAVRARASVSAAGPRREG